MQFNVPQFIETEDKIVGPLSLRQFLYVSGGVGISFLLYFTVKTWLWFVLSIFAVGGSVALAFVKINGRDLPEMLLAGGKYYWRPRQYVWQPDQPALSAADDTGGRSSVIERVVSGLALKRAWRYVQTGSAAEPQHPDAQTEHQHEELKRYQILHPVTGEHRAAKRIDYKY